MSKHKNKATAVANKGQPVVDKYGNGPKGPSPPKHHGTGKKAKHASDPKTAVAKPLVTSLTTYQCTIQCREGNVVVEGHELQ